jgi:hypothetical protein
MANMTLTQAIDWLQNLSCIEEHQTDETLDHQQWLQLESKSRQAIDIVEDFLSNSKMNLIKIEQNLWWEK